MHLKALIIASAIPLVATAPAGGDQAQTSSLSGGLPAPEAPEKPKAAKEKKPKRYSLWIRIGRCEQPGRQKPGSINWSHPGPRYGGGLGIYIGTWQAFKVRGMPATPGKASWRQQMWVANRIYNRYGGSHPWGCG